MVPACISICPFQRTGHNIFDDPDGELGISREAYYFIGGLMKHMKGMTVILNPLVNSYKRLVPGYEAPVYIAWSCDPTEGPLIPVFPLAPGRGSPHRA